MKGKKDSKDGEKPDSPKKSPDDSKDSEKAKKDGKDKPKADELPLSPTIAHSSKLSYTIRVKDYLVKGNAEDLALQLLTKGYKAYILSVWDPYRRLWHSVRIGRYNQFDEAAKAASEFSQKERLPGTVSDLGTLEFIPAAFLNEKTQPEKGKAKPEPTGETPKS